MNDNEALKAQTILQEKLDSMKRVMQREADEKIYRLEQKIEQAEIARAKSGLVGVPLPMETGKTKLVSGLVENLKNKSSAVSVGALSLSTKDFTDATAIVNESAVVITRDVGNFGSDYRMAQTPAVEQIPKFDLFNNSGVNLIPVVGTNSPYVDEVTTGEAGAQEVEGTNKPLIDVEYVETVVAVKTCAAYMRVSDQMLEDLSSLNAWIYSILRRKLQNKYNEWFFVGTGASGETDSLETLSPELNTAAYVTNYGVASIADVINACLTEISLNNFQADTIFMNPIDFYKMMSERASDEHYINGVATFRNYQTDNPFAARIVLTNYVAANTMYVCEIGVVNTVYKANMFNVPELGLNGEDFRQNMMSIRAHVRLENVVPTNHRGGLIKVSDIGAAVTAIAGVAP